MSLSLFIKEGGKALTKKGKEALKALQEMERGVATRAGGKKVVQEQGFERIPKTSTRDLGKGYGFKSTDPKKGSVKISGDKRAAIVRKGRQREVLGGGAAIGTGVLVNQLLKADEEATEGSKKDKTGLKDFGGKGSGKSSGKGSGKGSGKSTGAKTESKTFRERRLARMKKRLEDAENEGRKRRLKRRITRVEGRIEDAADRRKPKKKNMGGMMKSKMASKGGARGGKRMPTGMKRGGSLEMTMVDGRKVPAFAADGKGANDLAKKQAGGMMKSKGMAKGGAMKKKGYAMGGPVKKKGMAKGGAMKKKGYAMGGMTKKGMAKGGAMTKKGMAKGGSVRKTTKPRGVGAAMRGFGKALK